VVEGELGCPLEQVFSHFDAEPIASASIAQVHRAWLKPSSNTDSTESIPVAVKVQKPNIAVQNSCDLAVYHLMLFVVERSFDLPLEWTYEFTRRQLAAELDFRIEAQNAEQCAQELAQCQKLSNKV